MDENTGFYATLRGAPATQGRVAATEFQGRAQAQMARVKGRRYRFGTMVKRLIPQSLALWGQFGEVEDLKNLAGIDPFVALSCDFLLAGLQQDYTFAPATESLERAVIAQQLEKAMPVIQNNLGLQPESPALALLTRQYLSVLRIKQGDAIIDLATKEIEEAKAQAAKPAEEQAALAAAGPPAGAAPPEGAPPEGAPGEELPLDPEMPPTRGRSDCFRPDFNFRLAQTAKKQGPVTTCGRR